MFNVMLWNIASECILRGTQYNWEFETMQDAVDFSLTQSSDVQIALINNIEYDIIDTVGLSGDTAKILLLSKCHECSVCNMITASFCNIAILEAKDFTFGCLASMESECLMGLPMYLKRKVK